MPKNRSARAAKAHRQAKARTERSARTPSPNLASFPATLEALTERLAVGSLPVLCADGQVRQLTYDRIRAYFNDAFTAEGEPPLNAAELTRFLADSLVSGEMGMRADGLWFTSEDYFASSEVQA